MNRRKTLSRTSPQSQAADGSGTTDNVPSEYSVDISQARPTSRSGNTTVENSPVADMNAPPWA